MRRQLASLLALAGFCWLALGVGEAQAAPPSISALTVSHVTTSSAVLEAQINPNGKALNYRFEYGPAGADCTAEPATCVSTPKKVVPTGTSPVLVKEEVSGLGAGIAYHFRLVAVNAVNETATSPYHDFMPYLPGQEFSGCPNEAIRTQNPAAARVERQGSALPDCRAYEQASPVDKDGGDVSGTVPFERAAANGNGIDFISVSGVPGGEGSQEVPAYLATRSASGWSSKGMLPPAQVGQSAKILGWTPDYAGIFSRATRLGEPRTVALLRSAGAGGPLSTVVGYSPEANYLFDGASEDGSVVFFETGAEFGETGVEGTSELYAWDSESETLHQVDVFNDETSPAKGAYAGPYDWVKGTTKASLEAGGALRGYYTQDEHALAADGSALYFTEAGTGQLYLRLNPTKPQSAFSVNGAGEEVCADKEKACTLHVSASKKTNGKGEGGADSAGSKPAAFMAASADGRKSFFTSTEMLTNDANTGPEKEPAAVVRSDKEGKNRLNCAFTHAQAVAVDAEHIYWVDLESGAIGRAKIDCTEPEPEFIAAAQLEVEPGVLAPANPRALAAANGRLYWANAAREEGEGTIGRAKLNGAGAASEVEEEFIKGAGNPQGVAVDAEHVYWTDSSINNTDKSFIGKAKIDGTEVDSKLIEVFGVGKALTGVAVDAEHIYWVDTNNAEASRISRAKLDGSEYELTFIFLDSGGQGLALEGNHIYWAAQGPDAIGRAKLNGEGAASEVEGEFIKGAGQPKGLAVDGSHIYWSANAEASANPGKDLYRYDAEARTLEDLAPDSGDPDGAEVRGVLGASEDGSYLYFAANGVPNGTVGSPNARGEEATPGDCPDDVGSSTPGSCNLYLWHEGEVRFIARLQVGGNGTQTDAANWITTPRGLFTGGFQQAARVSADGKTLLFRSQGQLTDYENEGTAEFYRYTVGANEVSCVSCNPTGMGPVGGPDLGKIRPSAVTPALPASTLTYNLADEGKRVFFETTDALVGEDTNGDGGCPPSGADLQKFPACTDVYEWEAEGAGSCEAARAVAGGGCLYLLSTGKGSEPALIADASRSGNDVFFFTRSRLVGQDEDNLQDVYDARAEGGLAAQNAPPPSPPCESSDACHPSGPQPPEIAPPPRFSGPPNPKSKSQQPCPKGKHKAKGRCVAKKKAKKHKHGGKQKRAGAKGRQGR